MAKIIKRTEKKEEPKVEINEDITALFHAFKDKYGRTPKISQEIFQEFFDQEEEDHDESEWLDAIKDMEDRMDKASGKVQDKTPHVTDKLAAELASIAAKDEEFLGHITETVEYKETLKRLPATIALDMERLYEPEQIDAFPEPGLHAKDMLPGDNRKPDVMKVGVPSWYQDFWASLPISNQVKKDLESVKDKDGPGIKADRTMYQQRKTNGVGAVRTAVQILKGFNKFKAETNLVCSFRTEKKDGKKIIQRTTSPISIKFKDGSGEPRYFSVGTFKLLCNDKSFSKIVKAEDQMLALEVDRKRGTPKGSTPVNVQSVPQGMQAYFELGIALKDDPEFRSGLYEEADKKEELGDELVLSMHYVARYTNRYLDKPAVKARLDALLEREEAKKKKDEDKAEKKDAA